MKMQDEQMERIWSHTDRNGMVVPLVEDDPYATHFGGLPSEVQMESLRWLLLNIRPAKPDDPDSYIAADEIAELLCHYTSVFLTGTQVREALLLLGTRPYDASSGKWTYRIGRDCPCASIAADGCGGIRKTDRRCFIAG